MNWWLSVVSNEFKKVFMYKALFWFDFFISTTAHVFISYLLWDAIFESQSATEIKGYTLRGLVFYYLAATLVEKINQGAGWKAGASIEIYDGGLTRYLLYPVNFVRYKSASHFAHYLMNIIKALVGFAVFAIFFGMPAEVRLSFESVFMALLFTALSSYLYLLITLLVDFVAFWADNVWSLQVMIKFISQLLGGSLIPIVMFPQSWQEILVYLPFVSFFSNPVRALMGQMTWAEVPFAVGVSLFWIGVVHLLMTWVWNRGLRNYSGVGV